MKGSRKIQDKNLGYTLLNRYTRAFFPLAYSRIEYHGLENIPKDAAIIYAPNHTNALMDALVVLFVDKKPKVFVSRADIFRNPKVAQILNFLKIMPVMRIRDGYENLKKNAETFDKAVDVLCSGTPFCILPEGTHRAMHSLLPLSKGIFRIALHAADKLPADKPLYIVPFGIEYGNFFRYHSSLLVNIGRPINVREFRDSAIVAHAAHSDEELTDPELINSLKEELTLRMKENITYIPDDSSYETLRTYCAMNNSNRGSLYDRLKRNQQLLRDYFELKKKDPAAAAQLFEKADKMREKLAKKKISLSSLTKKHLGLTVFLRALVTLICLPYCLTGLILCFPIPLISQLVFKPMKDDAFYNSLRFPFTAILWPILFLIYSIITLCLMNTYGCLNIGHGLVAILLIWFLNQASTWYYRFCRRFISDVKYLFIR